MMKKMLLLSILIALFLAGCVDEVSPTELPTPDATLLYLTAEYQITQDAVTTQVNLPTDTLTPIPTQTVIPTLDRTRSPIETPTPEIPCNIAAAGHPLDISIPDGTLLGQGQSFSKTWRLENVGSCTWTRLYSVTFFSGNPLDAIQTHYLLSEVPPGGVVDLTVDMTAPDEPGTYQSNWMLMDHEGNLFGIGPNGDAPFWARIEVVMEGTATPQATPSPTVTPVIYLSGESEIASGNQFDLDSGDLNPEDTTLVDFLYTFGGTPAYLLTNANETQWVVFGQVEPTYSECLDAERVDEPLGFTEVPFGTYICYQTSESLHGWLLINGIIDDRLVIRFQTWALP